MADHFVIDGSNLATEGRTEPSLAQLREAVAAFLTEHEDATVTVVVDASFEHRIDPSERAAFAKAEINSEVVSPPAGAVGRGDGFLLQIANRTNATVVSNDSFQEFHAEYEWLFEPGRLIGGKPVPGVGWIFSLRRPVRGIVSRKTTQRAKKEAKNAEQVREAIAEATADALTNQTGGRRRRRGTRNQETTETTEPEAVNQPAPFLQFVIDHRLGTDVEGVVDAFSSHGAFVNVDDVRCYIPLGAMGDPRPTRARDVLTRGETRTFVIQAVDAPRRGIELALPGFAKVAGAPSDETVEAELRRRRPKKAKAATAMPATTPAPTRPRPRRAADNTSGPTKATGTKATAKTPATGPPAKKRTTATKAPAAKQATKAATKAPAAKAPATTAPAARARTTAAKDAGGPRARKSSAKKVPAKKTTTKAPAAKQAGPTKKAGEPAVPARQTPAKSSPAKKGATAAKTTRRGSR